MKIAIVGCGVGGLAAATFLNRTKHNITLFDQFASPAPVGSGLVIQPVGLKVLAHLGADEDALAMGQKIYNMYGTETKRNRAVLDVAYGPNGGTEFGLAIHRASLFEALFKTAQKQGVKIVTDHKVTQRLSDGRLQFENGQTSDAFDLVIDASGANSPLSPLKARRLDFGAIWGCVDWPENSDLPKYQLSQRYRQAKRMIGILPMGKLPNDDKQKAALFWSLPKDNYQDWRERPLSHWHEQAIALWPTLEPFIEQIQTHDNMTMARYSHGTLKKPYSAGLVHIGDAAHRASPQLGQGANMALLDAFALCHSLCNYPLEKALPAYAHARRWHVGIYQMMSWAFTPMYQSNSYILPVLRDWLLAPASTIPPVPKILSSLVKGTTLSPYRGIDETDQSARLISYLQKNHSTHS